MAETVRQFIGRENYLAKQFVLDISNKLWEFEPSANPFIVMATKMGTQTAHNTKVEWIEENPIPERVTYTGATESSAGTSLTFTNYSYLRIGDELFNPRTHERILVTATPSSATVSVARDLGSETGGAGLLNQGDVLEITGSVREEGNSFASTDPRMNIPTEQYNYVQLFMDWAQVTRTAANCQQAAGGSLFQHQVQKALRNHRKKIEKTIFWGARANTLGAGGHYKRSLGGIHSKIDTHTWNVNGELTPAGFDWFLEQILDDTPDNMKKTLFCPNFVAGRISNWGRNYVRYNPGRSKKYGFQVDEYIGGSGGGVDIVRCPIFRGSNWMKGIGFLIEMDKVFFKYLKGGKTTMTTKCETAKDDYHLAKIRSEFSIIFANEARHGFLYNVTG